MPITGFSHYLIQNPILALFLICHFLSDFHLQGQTVADRKNTDKKYLLIHLLGVALPLVLVTCFLPSLWLTSLLILLSHAIIDFGKSCVAKWLRLNAMSTFFSRSNASLSDYCVINRKHFLSLSDCQCYNSTNFKHDSISYSHH